MELFFHGAFAVLSILSLLWLYLRNSSRYLSAFTANGLLSIVPWARFAKHKVIIIFSYKQSDLTTILDLLTTGVSATREWDWGTGSPRVPSAVAQQRPVWPIGAKPSSAPGSLIMNTPTLALWFSIGWITIAGDGFCAKKKKKMFQNVQMFLLLSIRLATPSYVTGVMLKLNETNVTIKHDNWRKADQLAFFKHDWRLN